MKIEVKSVEVLCRKYHADLIYITVDLPYTFTYNPEDSPYASFRAEATKGTGAAWVRDNLKMEPEIIDV